MSVVLAVMVWHRWSSLVTALPKSYFSSMACFESVRCVNTTKVRSREVTTDLPRAVSLW